MIDPLTRQPILPPNGLTAPAANLQGLQQPPQPNTAAAAQGVPSPQQPGPWGANPFAAAQAPDGTGDGQAAFPIQMQPQPVGVQTGPMNGPPMPRRAAPAPAMPMPSFGDVRGPSIHDPNLTLAQPSPSDPNFGGPGPMGQEPFQVRRFVESNQSPNDNGFDRPVALATGYGTPSASGMPGSGPGGKMNYKAPYSDPTPMARSQDNPFGNGPIAKSNKLGGLSKTKQWAAALMNGPVEAP